MNELKPCPFCGNEIIDGQASDHKEDCYMLMVTVLCPPYLVEEIQKAWNKRASNWISVKDSLPDNGILVLVCSELISYMAAHTNGHFYDLFDGDALDLISHWQPLPKPMKES